MTAVGYLDRQGAFKYNLTHLEPVNTEESEDVLFTIWVCSRCGDTSQQASSQVLTTHKLLRRTWNKQLTT